MTKSMEMTGFVTEKLLRSLASLFSGLLNLEPDFGSDFISNKLLDLFVRKLEKEFRSLKTLC